MHSGSATATPGVQIKSIVGLREQEHTRHVRMLRRLLGRVLDTAEGVGHIQAIHVGGGRESALVVLVHRGGKLHMPLDATHLTPAIDKAFQCLDTYVGPLEVAAITLFDP